MKHIFIVNKISGKGSGKALIPLIEEICKEKKLDYKIHLTEYSGHATKLARQYNGKTDVVVYAVGGDGTLLEVVNGLDLNQEFGLIPAGSGNDFYRLIGNDPRDAGNIIIDTIDAKARQVDIGETDKMRFLNVTSFGIDADVTENASRMIRHSFISKGPAYILSILKNVLIIHPKKIKITADGKDLSGNYLIVAIMNGRYYGNGVKASPYSDIQDGKFDLCLFENIKAYKAYPFLAKYLKGQHLGYEGFKIVRVKDVIIDSEKEINCQSDGENYGIYHLHCRILKGALKLKVPGYLSIIHSE